jgi:hypothetical protein
LKNSSIQNFDCSYKDSNGNKIAKTCSLHYLTKKATVSTNVQMRSAQNNTLIFGDSISYKFDKTWMGLSAQDTISNSMSDEEIMTLLLRQIARDIVYAVTPHREEVKKVSSDR